MVVNSAARRKKNPFERSYQSPPKHPVDVEAAGGGEKREKSGWMDYLSSSVLYAFIFFILIGLLTAGFFFGTRHLIAAPEEDPSALQTGDSAASKKSGMYIHTIDPANPEDRSYVHKTIATHPARQVIMRMTSVMWKHKLKIALVLAAFALLIYIIISLANYFDPLKFTDGTTDDNQQPAQPAGPGVVPTFSPGWWAIFGIGMASLVALIIFAVYTRSYRNTATSLYVLYQGEKIALAEREKPFASYAEIFAEFKIAAANASKTLPKTLKLYEEYSGIEVYRERDEDADPEEDEEERAANDLFSFTEDELREWREKRKRRRRVPSGLVPFLVAGHPQIILKLVNFRVIKDGALVNTLIIEVPTGKANIFTTLRDNNIEIALLDQLYLETEGRTLNILNRLVSPGRGSAEGGGRDPDNRAATDPVISINETLEIPVYNLHQAIYLRTRHEVALVCGGSTKVLTFQHEELEAQPVRWLVHWLTRETTAAALLPFQIYKHTYLVNVALARRALQEKLRKNHEDEARKKLKEERNWLTGDALETEIQKMVLTGLSIADDEILQVDSIETSNDGEKKNEETKIPCRNLIPLREQTTKVYITGEIVRKSKFDKVAEALTPELARPAYD